MALTEQTIIKQITIKPAQRTVEVQWSNQVLRNGEVISEAYTRKAYIAAQQAEFEADVAGAASYVAAVGW